MQRRCHRFYNPQSVEAIADLGAVILLNSPTNSAYEYNLYSRLRQLARSRSAAPSKTGPSSPVFVAADGAIDFLCHHSGPPTAAATQARLEEIWPDIICGDMDSSSEGCRCVVAGSAFQVAKVENLVDDPDFVAKWSEGRQQSMVGDESDEDTRSPSSPRQSITIRVGDQDTTDFEKCLQTLALVRKTDDASKTGADEGEQIVLVLGGLGGRFDHEMAAINVLACHTDIPLVIHNVSNSMFIVPAGSAVEFERNKAFESGTCGVIPLGSRLQYCRTKGLKWDLEVMGEATPPGTPTFGFGAMLSTSNEVVDDAGKVMIDARVPDDVLPETQPPLLFTIALLDLVAAK